MNIYRRECKKGECEVAQFAKNKITSKRFALNVKLNRLSHRRDGTVRAEMNDEYFMENNS